MSRTSCATVLSRSNQTEGEFRYQSQGLSDTSTRDSRPGRESSTFLFSKPGGRTIGKLEATHEEGASEFAQYRIPKELELEPQDAEQGQQETETLKSEGLLGVVGQLNASIRRTPGQLWLHTKVETQSIDWLVDTGAAITLIDGETWETLPHKGPLETEDRKIVGAGGERIKIYGKCQLEARVGTLQLPIVALVGRLAFPAILGLDTLNQWGAVINVGKGTIEVDTQPTPSQHFLEGGDLLVSCINHQAAPRELEG